MQHATPKYPEYKNIYKAPPSLVNERQQSRVRQQPQQPQPQPQQPQQRQRPIPQPQVAVAYGGDRGGADAQQPTRATAAATRVNAAEQTHIQRANAVRVGDRQRARPPPAIVDGRYEKLPPADAAAMDEREDAAAADSPSLPPPPSTQHADDRLQEQRRALARQRAEYVQQMKVGGRATSRRVFRFF